MEDEKKQEEIQDINQTAETEVKVEAAPEVKGEETKQEKPKDKLPPKVEISKSCGSCKKPVAKMRYYRNMQFFCNTKCWKDFKKKEEQRKLKEAEENKQQEQAPAA
ncbi:MAG: hypothetical protein KJ915_06855 [Candidatus Omnitrophica bacterium]|nr:hypothetical protein [Candidatus Omnitrophota bacterium]